MSSAEKTRQYYEEYENYERQLVNGYGWHVPRIIAERHMQHGRPHRDAVVLDVGCGTGLVGAYLRRKGFRGRLNGVDFAKRRLREAAERTQRGRRVYDTTRRADARDLPWTVALFDGIVSSGMLGLCGPKAFNEMLRVLRPGYWMTVAVGKILQEPASVRYFDRVRRRIEHAEHCGKLVVVHREDLGTGYTSGERDDEHYELYVLRKEGPDDSTDQ